MHDCWRCWIIFTDHKSLTLNAESVQATERGHIAMRLEEDLTWERQHSVHLQTAAASHQEELAIVQVMQHLMPLQ